MNIDRVNQNLAAGAYGARRAKGPERGKDAADAAAAGGASGPSLTDGVELSDEARLAARVGAAVRAAPDTRDALVADLRQRIQAGTYQVDDQAVAERLVAEDQA